MKWRKIEEYFKGGYDWVLIRYYDKRDGYECVPNVAEYNNGKWHINDASYTELYDIFEVKYFIDMQEIKEGDK